MKFEDTLYDKRDSVARITINRSKVYNAFRAQSCAEIIDVGTSGTIQPFAGMKGSHVIVVVDKNEEAPIFRVADYGLVGDLFQVVPAIVDEMKG